MDAHKAVKSSCAIRFDVVQRTVDAPADGLPVDPHIFGNSTPGQVHCKPSNSEVKVFCEPAAGICPGDISHTHAMFRTDNPVCLVFHFDNDSLPVQPPPYTRGLALAVIAWTFFVTDGAIILVPSARAGGNSDAVCPINACFDFQVFDDAVLDIEQLFA